jgi:L-rhamnose isomerase/sugar isomerase
LLVDREALDHYQTQNDVIMAEQTLRAAYETDVRPLVAELRRREGGALRPVTAYRASGYRAAVTAARASAAYAPPQSL